MAKSVRESMQEAEDGMEESPVQKWTGVIAAYDREFKKWDSRVTKILKRYRDENRGNRDSTAKFNILWSNVQTLVPAVFAKVPKPDVSRRFRDNDPVGRVSALILERAEEYEVEHYPDFYRTLKQCVQDRFLGGRGTAWVRYEPHFRAVAQDEPTDGLQISEDVDEPQEELDYECAPVDYVHWKDFGHSVARTWEEVTSVWRRVFLTEEQVEARFGEEMAERIPMDAKPDEIRRTDRTEMGGDGEGLARAEIYEIWDKESKKVYWICKSVSEPLDVKDDPLHLDEFWPCPKPLFATLTNDTLVPVPDFTLYQDQAKSLDVLADRIAGLVNMLKVMGCYDAAIPEIARLFTEGENGNLVPVKNWQAFAEKNGLDGAINMVDLKPIYEALEAAYRAFQQQMQQVYDITGISDIIRGQSEANETATAQRIKGQYASLRLKALQYEVANFASQILQLKAQVICTQFSPQTIATIGGVAQLAEADIQYVQPALALLVGDARMVDPDAEPGPNPMRQFRIEVNADTMIQMDEEEEKQKRIEFISAQGAFMEKALPMVEQAPHLAPLVAALWKFSVGAFKIGKTLEGEFDAVIDQAKKLAANPPPKMDAEMERVKADAQAQQQRAQADMQIQQQKIQSDMMLEKMKMQMDAQAEQQRMQMEAQAKQQEMSFMQMFEKWKAELGAQTQVQIAQIKADAMPAPETPQ